MKTPICFILMLCSHFLIGQTVAEYTQHIYYGNIQGVSAALKIEPGYEQNDQTENRYYGQMVGGDGSSYVLMGNLTADNKLTGSLWDQYTLQEYKFSIAFQDSGLLFSFGLDEQYGTTIAFSRQASTARIDTTKAQLDPLMVGVWSRTESYSDPNSGFSYVIEQRLYLNEDGSSVFYSKSAGGNNSVTGSTNGQTLQGQWKTEEKHLFTRDNENDAWMNNGAYLVDENNMMLKQAGGNKLWNRLR